MKKLFFLLSFLIGGMTLHAQIMDLNDVDWEVYGILHDQPLITSVDQLLSPYSDEQEGLHIEYLLDGDINTFWHSDWHGRVEGTPYIEVVMPEPIEGYVAITFGRRNSGSCHPTRLELQTSVDNETWTSAGACDFEYKAVHEYVISTPFYVPAGTTRMRVYTVNRTNTVGNLNDIGVGTYHMAEFQMYAMDNNFGKEYTLSKLLEKYDAYLAGEKVLNMGTAIGQYTDTDAEQAFLGGLAQANELLASGGYTAYDNSQIVQIVIDVEDSYAKVLASEVEYKIPANGYYRIHCNMQYYKEEDTDEIDLDGNPVTKRVEVPCAMYGSTELMPRWGPLDNSDCRFVWKIEQQENGVRMANAATGEHFNRLDDITGIGLLHSTLDQDSLLVFDYAGREGDRDIIYIRFAGLPKDLEGNASSYFHQIGHQLGANYKGDYFCYWKATFNMEGDKGTSEYWLEAVSEDEVAELLASYEIIANREKMVSSYWETIERAKVALRTARKGAYTPLTDQPLITDASQLHSLWSDSEEGQHLEHLLDGDGNTFWHSTWHGWSYDFSTHSLDIALPDNTLGKVQVWIQRRFSGGDDHITNMDIYGTNDAANLEQPSVEGWTPVVRDLITPWFRDQKEVSSPEFELKESFKYLRLLVKDTDGINYSYRNFFHLGDIQIYPMAHTGHCQYEYMVEAGDRLQALVDASYSLNDESITLEKYNELQEAWNQFGAFVIDPEPLINAIASSRNAADVVEEGSNPGFWTDTTLGTQLQEAVDGAQAYLSAAHLTEEGVNEWIEKITGIATSVMTSTNQINPAKWYRIRFGTLEEYEKHGWNTTSAQTEHASLFGKVIAPGQFVEGTDGQPNGVAILPHEDIRIGAGMNFVDPDVLAADDYCVWRFVPVEEDRWAMQHKYTGMYLQRDRYHGESVHMDIQPTIFEVKPLGKGEVAFVMTDWAGFTWERNYLNAWCDHYQLQTWTPETMGGNSGYFIEEVGDIDEEDINSFFYYDVKPGNIYGMCYPVPMVIGGGTMFTVAGTFVENDAQFIALSQIEEAAAGIPFIYIADGEYSDEADITPVEMRLGSEVAKEPATVNGLKAHFTPLFLDPGFVLFANGKASAQNGNNVSVLSNEAYLSFGASPLQEDAEYDLAIQIDGIAADGIAPVLNKLAKAGDAYDLSGRLVQKNATLNTLKNLKPGIYVLGGVKVMVK